MLDVKRYVVAGYNGGKNYSYKFTIVMLPLQERKNVSVC